MASKIMEDKKKKKNGATQKKTHQMEIKWKRPSKASYFISASQYNIFPRIIFLANGVVVPSCF